MATPKELRASIVENRGRLQEALHGAHTKWTVKPAAGEGEEAWSPSEVAKHVIGSERFFTNLICKACGAPELDRADVDVSAPAKAAASLSNIGAADDGMLRHVSDGDMEKSVETRMGTMTVAQMLEILVSHTNDHIAQIAAASA